MRTVQELIDIDSPAWPMVQEWTADAANSVELLECNAHDAGIALEQLQVSTRSPLGALAYKTSGMLIDGGWVRVLGCGGERISGSLVTWNGLGGHPLIADTSGMFLVAHDVLGGFFALDGRGLGGEPGGAFYFAPDSLRWEELKRGYSDLLQFFFSGDLAGFYGQYRWKGWMNEVTALTPDQGYSLYPPLWTKEGKDVSRVSRRPVPMTELLRLELDMARKLDGMNK